MTSSAEEVAWSVANGHAYERHASEFENIRDRTDLQNHVQAVLESPETECFTGFNNDPRQHADIYYHAPSNTLVVVPYADNLEPTAYRPQLGRETFEWKLDLAKEAELLNIEVVRSIYELKPELVRPLELQKQEQSDEFKKLSEALDRRFEQETKRTEERQEKEINALGSEDTEKRAELNERHEQELEAQREKQESERARYVREREQSKELAAELERDRKERELSRDFNKSRSR